MRRQGWAFCLGMFVSGSVWAQPPADEERFPPAPMLPGVVVSKPAGSTEKPVANGTTSFGITRVSGTMVETPSVPATTFSVPPTLSAITAPVPASCAPTACPAPVCPTPMCPTASCPAPCAPGHMSHLPEWLKFRSQAKQSGHVPYPYSPQLYAWFPPGCVTNKPTAFGSPANCATGQCGSTIVPMAPMTHGPAMPTMAMPQPVYTGSAYPVAPVYTPSPKLVAPNTASTPSEPDHLAGFRKINDGLLFTPGGSPMAAPVKPVSRPK